MYLIHQWLARISALTVKEDYFHCFPISIMSETYSQRMRVKLVHILHLEPTNDNKNFKH